MPTRNQAMVRRDINRLNDLVQSRKEDEVALAAIEDVITEAAQKVNTAWQAYQVSSVAGDKEREERDTAVANLLSWVQRWRPVIMIKVPGAEANIRTLPASGTTPDDVIRVAEDMQAFVNNNEAAAGFSETMTTDLGTRLEAAKKEIQDATAALPQEAADREGYSEACIEANTILVRGLDIVRTAFGRTSPEYKQFIARTAAEENEEAAETADVTG